MNEPMTHYTVLVFHQDYAAFLKRLRDVGLLHVATPLKEHFPGNAAWLETKQRSTQLDRMLAEMKDAVEGASFAEPQGGGEPETTEAVAEVWEQWQERGRSLARHISSMETDIRQMEPWGDFNHTSIEGLRQAGWKTGFWETTPANWNPDWQKEHYATIIYSDKRKLRFITFSPVDEEPELRGADKVRILPSPSSTMIMLQTKAKDDLRKLRNQMGDYALTHGQTVEQRAREAREQLRLMRIELSTPTVCDGGVKMLTGWVPTRRDGEMEQWLREQEAVVWFTREHREGERYPTLFHHTWSHWLYVHTVHPFRLAFDRKYRNSARFQGRSKYRPFR